MPSANLSDRAAEQVVRYLDGTRHVAFATVTPKGQPRVSLLDTLFLHGRFPPDLAQIQG